MEKRIANLAAHSVPTLSSVAIDRMIGYLKSQTIAPEDIKALYEPIYEAVGFSQETRFSFAHSVGEATHQLLWSVLLEVVRKTGKCHFITTPLEERSTLNLLKRLEELGCFVHFVSLNEQGQIDCDHLKQLISPRTALITMTAADGLTGVIQPIDEVEEIARKQSVLLHLDISYALGKLDCGATSADYVTFSGSLIHGPHSSAGLFANRNAPLIPIADKKEDIALLAGLSGAMGQLLLNQDAMTLEMIRLRNGFEQIIQSAIPEANILFKESLRLPNVTTISFPGAHQEALLYLLNQHLVNASIGGDLFQPLRQILQACRIEGDQAMSFSMDRMITEQEVYQSASIVIEQVRLLRHFSEDL